MSYLKLFVFFLTPPHGGPEPSEEILGSIQLGLANSYLLLYGNATVS
jgi:hypothetical protein